MAATAGEESAAGTRAGRVGWRRGLLVILAAAFAFPIAGHVFGGRLAGEGLGVLAGAVLLGYVIYRLPRLRRHFARPGGSLNYPGQRGKGLLRPPSRAPAAHRRWELKLPGSSRRASGSGRSGGSGRKGPGLRLPGSGRKGSGTGPGRKGTGLLRRSRAGTGSGRRGSVLGKPGTGRKGTGLFRRSRAGTGTGTGRKGTGLFRRSRAGTGTGRRRPARSMAGLIAARRRRSGAGTPGTPAGRRKLTRPAAWRRRPRPGSTPGGGPQRLGRRQALRARRAARAAAAGAAGRRKLTKPSTWRKRKPFTAGPGGIQVPRRSLSRPSTWRRPRTPAAAAAAVRRARRQRPGPVRRGLHRIAGTPQQRHNRAAAWKARQAAGKARRLRLARNPYRSRVPWHAPWRIWTRGPGARARFHRWRVNRGHVAPRDARGRRLPWRTRIARRWNIRRGRHRGLGLGQRRLTLRARLARQRARLAAGIARRRTRTPPRSLAAAGRHLPRRLRGRLARLDRRRQDRWARRNQRGGPGAVWRPGTPAPVPAGSRAPAGRAAGMAITGGKGMTDTAAMADEIRSLGGSEFADPQDVHEYLQNVHQMVEALQENLAAKADQMAEMGVHQAYPEAVQEAASGMAGIADQLHSVTAGGVMRGPGG
ncbi:MAG TPA: hypothetical protein VNH17_18055 [Streptosporangiaceae bacterium]|nr:hypothetical protein [Streptosporangiaceae bacterium]